MKKNDERFACELSEAAIYEAMKEIQGYIDITPDDFQDIYRHAYQHAYHSVLNKNSGMQPASAGHAPPTTGKTPAEKLGSYLRKMRGAEKSPPKVSMGEICWSWIGAFAGIAAVAYCNFNLLKHADILLLIGSFGASAALLYGAVKSPLAQPRNLLGGHILSAVIGVAAYQLLHAVPWLAAAVAVATAIAAMHATKTLHPPGGATALIAVIGSAEIHNLGYLYVLAPVGCGAAIMLLVALVVNNLSAARKYPEFWW